MITLNYLNEEWRDIKGYEGYYQVSNYGRVKSLERSKRKHTKYGSYTCILKGRILRFNKTNSGYNTVLLYNDSHSERFLVHRLVGRAFPEICGEWFDCCVIDHINGVKTDNMAINIKLTNQFTNVNNMITLNKMRNGRKKQRKKVLQYSINGEFIREFDYLR